MDTVVPGLILIVCIVGAVDFLTNLKATFTGDKVALNAVVKVALAWAAAVGIVLLAAQTTIAKGYDLNTILPVDAGTTLKSLSFADACFAALVIAFNGSIIASFRKAIDGSQTASQPSLTNQ